MTTKTITTVPLGNGPAKPRAYFTSKKGKRFYASDYGHKAWPIGKSGKPKVK